MLNAYICAITAVTIGLVYLGYSNQESGGYVKADFYVARGLCVVLGLVALETLVALILEIYRPRVSGKVVRPLYDSRLVGLLSHPEGLFTTAREALDYQFGFKVSETWAFQMLAEKFVPFVAGLVVAAILSSCLVFLEPGEEALVERFGHAATERTVLGPGPHFKLPWPVDEVYRFQTGRVQSFNVGFVPDPARANDPTVLWTIQHYKEEYNLLVASRELAVATNGQRPPGRRRCR